MTLKMKTILLVLVLIAMMGLVGLLTNFNEGITGGTVAGSIACDEDKDCDDGIEATEDICRNPGTEYSLCVNQQRE